MNVSSASARPALAVKTNRSAIHWLEPAMFPSVLFNNYTRNPWLTRRFSDIDFIEPIKEG